MPIITWTREQFATDVDSHDHEHQMIFKMLNDLHELSTAGDRDAVGRQLDALIGYVAEHFAAEERHMQQVGFAGFNAHKAEHDKLVGIALNLQGGFRAGAAEVDDAVTGLVRDWLTHHIPTFDKAYAGPMRAGGIH